LLVVVVKRACCPSWFLQIDSSCYASHGLQSALDDYRRACYEAAAAVRQHLRDLARELQVAVSSLMGGGTEIGS
jgi:hypothetical protein